MEKLNGAINLSVLLPDYDKPTKWWQKKRKHPRYVRLLITAVPYKFVQGDFVLTAERMDGDAVLVQALDKSHLLFEYFLHPNITQ